VAELSVDICRELGYLCVVAGAVLIGVSGRGW
jgi:hypothetical protein